MENKQNTSESKLSSPVPEKKVSLSQALAEANTTPSSPLGKVLAAKKQQESVSDEGVVVPSRNLKPFLLGGFVCILIAFFLYGYILFSKWIFHTTVDNPTFEQISYILDGKEYFLAPKETKNIFLLPGVHTLTIWEGDTEEEYLFKKPWNKQKDLLNPTYSPYIVQYVLIWDEEKYSHVLPQGSVSYYDDHLEKTSTEWSGNFTEVREYYQTGNWNYHVDELIPPDVTTLNEYEVAEKLSRYIDWYTEENIYMSQENEDISEDIWEITPEEDSTTRRSWITESKPIDLQDSKEKQEWDTKLEKENWFTDLEEEYERFLQEDQENDRADDRDPYLDDDENDWIWEYSEDDE